MVAPAELDEYAGNGLHNPDTGDDGERKCTPVNECGVALLCEDGPERPGNCYAGRQVTLRARECVRCGSSLEEEPMCEWR